MNVLLRTKAQRCINYFQHDQYEKLAKMTEKYSVAKLHELKEAVLELCISNPEKYRPSFLILSTSVEDGDSTELELKIAGELSKKWRMIKELNADKVIERKEKKERKKKKKQEEEDDFDDDFI
ncbi:MAG: hypothetical protein PHN80_12865 [Hespellia sp.]|nr:hypothetical protein [Hespellia sp.]